MNVLRPAWYRLTVTLRRRWAGYLGLVLIIGLTGGVALGAAAAARRTESSFPVFLASTNPSDLTVQYQASAPAGLPPFARVVAGLPLVRHAESAVEPVADVLGPGGAPLPASIAASLTVASVASVDGLYFDQDRVGVLAGRMADPASRDEIMMNARAASLLGLRVGELVPIGFYTDAQAGSPGYGTARVRPVVRIEARITGLVEFNDELVQDDTDRPQGDLLFTPALTKTLLAAGTSSGISWYGLKLDGGAGSVPAVEREADARLGAGGAAWFRVASADEAQVQSSIEPDWIALAAFAVIALAVTLLVGAQAIARQVRAGDADRMVLRALGAGPAMVAADSLLGLLGAVTAGALLAVAVAVAFSPVAPIGPVRPVYPAPGVAFDWTVLGGGFLLLAGVFGAVAVILAARAAARRAAWTASPAVPARGSAAGRLAVASGLPAAAVAGFQFAFDSGAGRGRRAVPARSALSAAVLAVVIVMTTLTFGASLSALVSRPALYGWNWSYALASNQGPEAVPGQQVDGELRAAPGVAAWATVSMRHRRPGRAGRSRAVRRPERDRRAADPVRGPGYRQEPGRARSRHAGGAAPARGRHGVVHPHRARPAAPGSADHRGHGDDADGGPVGRAAHLDGHRRAGVRPAPGAGGGELRRAARDDVRPVAAGRERGGRAGGDAARHRRRQQGARRRLAGQPVPR